MNPLIIKLGGALLDSDEAMARLFCALAAYRQEHQRELVIVHGGGCVVDELMKKLALPVVRRNGLRVTPADQIGTITGALAGTANKPYRPLPESTALKPLVCVLQMAIWWKCAGCLTILVT